MSPKPFTIVPDAVYTTAETARFLRLQKATLENWRSNHAHRELRFRRVGRRVVYTGRDILAFLDGAARPRRKR